MTPPRVRLLQDIKRPTLIRSVAIEYKSKMK